MLDILFQILINPIYVLIEIIYNFLFKFCSFNQTFSIIFLSVIVNFLWLPLYLNADKLKIENDEIQKKLKKKADAIKKNFKGEERHMLLAAYYRENNYHPIYALRGTLSLVLQMIFFVAAYLFFVQNLPSNPDGLLKTGQIKINLLPVLMTLINLIAGLIYVNKHNTKKIQIWVISLFFLVVLYNAPYTLVLYWTFNNLFSLIKNIILTKEIKFSFKKPLFFIKLSDFIKKQNTDKTDLKTCYFLVCVCLWLFVGLLIPWNLLSSAPPKFFYIYPYITPFPFLFYHLVKTFGIFVFWGWVVYSFSCEKYRNLLTSFLIILFYFFVFNYCYIEYPYGEVTNTLEFTTHIGSKILAGSYYFILFFIILISVILLLKKRDIIKKTFIIFLLAVFVIGIYDTREIINLGKKVPLQSENFEPFYNFSKNNKNVLIIFIDKAIGSYLPLIFKEKPSLKKHFEGFVYYPNIVSFGCYTRLAYPALMGGYEYSPLNMDLDLNKSLKEKYNESILLLPKIFKNNGFETTITDTPWGDFQYITPKELFLKEGIKYDNLMGKYSSLYKKKYSFSHDKSSLYDLERNLLYFSFMKIAPLCLRDFIIDNNNYLNLNKKEIRYTNDLLASYSSLYFLDKITRFDSKNPTFTIINNELTHNADCFLEYPDYKLTFKPVIKTPYNLDRYSSIHYHSNAACIRLVAKYLDFLKENGIYDNTRIIIVSDHGAKNLKNPYLNKKIEDNIARFNALLLVKDFNQRGDMKVSDEFMTNADVPYIALKDVIKNPTNPYTSNLIKIDKTPPLVLIARTKRFNLKEKGNTPFDNKTDCISVKDNIFKVENWQGLKKQKVKKIRKKNRENARNKNLQ